MAEPTQHRRLLFLINDAGFFVTHRLPLAIAAFNAGFEVHAALPFAAESVANQNDLDAIRVGGVILHDLPMRRGGMGPLQEIFVLARIWRLFLRLSPDILHCITIKPVLYGGALARMMRIPRVILAVPGLGHVFVASDVKMRLVRWLVTCAYDFVLGNPRAIAIFQNPDDRTMLIKGRGRARARAVLIPGVGVDTALFHPAATPPADPPVVMLPARLHQEKGVRDFVAAAQLLRSRSVTVRMVLTGYADFNRPGGIGEAELQSWCSAGIIEWWGHSTDMPQTLRQAHIVCLPSHGGEGFPKVLIEAGATALPVVTTDVPGCRDAVRAGETALVVPPHNAAALADALAQLLGDPALRARMGAMGRELAGREYSAARFIAASMALYTQPPDMP